MGNKLSFPADTGDAIEKTWWSTVSKEFPTYARFWEDFIGLKNKSDPFAPYGLIFPPGTCASCVNVVQSAYKELTEAHYSAFCELAGAHYQMQEVERSYSSPAADPVFLFLESFNTFYDHLGTARNMAFRTWLLSRTISQAIAPNSPLSMFSLKGDYARPLIESRLRSAGRNDLVSALGLIEQQVIRFRNHHVHDYAARFELHDDKRFYYVLPSDESTLQSKKFGWTILSEECGTRMKRHLRDVESFLDGSEGVLASELWGSLTTGGIHVDY